mmetsp:Transcript_4654/g.7755  ORF Transcript_4654/g.7755 Transcript_4654/m.7755 type:complete len:263 (-) Transcript_4654:843-1631(-)
MLSPPPSFSCSCGDGSPPAPAIMDDCAEAKAKSLLVNDTTRLAMERLPPERTSALAMAAAALARRVPNEREGATAAVDRIDGPRLALATLSVPVAALCTVNGLWDRLRGGRCSSDGVCPPAPPSSAMDISNSSALVERRWLSCAGTSPASTSVSSPTAMASVPCSRGTSSSNALRETFPPARLSPPRVVEVTTVDAMVVLVTLVGRLDMPSMSPRTARVEMPGPSIPPACSCAWMGLRRMDSRLEIRFLELWVGVDAEPSSL